ncbi:MAG: hypothetical protein JWP48_7141 [Actinoallomurus sp.]|nr:hypothetical protein [Actinoallomurus sp.]
MGEMVHPALCFLGGGVGTGKAAVRMINGQGAPVGLAHDQQDGWWCAADEITDAEHGSGLGIFRWVAEAAFALLHWFRRLRIRWEIRDDIHEAFLTLGCAIICRRRLHDTLW